MKSNKLTAVVFDWAGTIVDYGCCAPTKAFMNLFNEHDVPITAEEVRQFMGLHKRDHIKGILGLPRVAHAWMSIRKKEPNLQDIEQLFHQFVPLQIRELEHTKLIPGTKKTVEACRNMGLKIGTCTGYTKVMMEALAHAAQREGFEPDAVVCSDEVPLGRPSPFMCFENAMRLGVYPMESMLKVGDTPEDIKEGLNAGMWTVGLARTGNLLGLTQQEDEQLSAEDRNHLLGQARATLASAQAHFVVDSVEDILSVIDEIHKKLSLGERP